MKTPCKKCPDRHIGCHAECDSYKDWAAQRSKVLKAASEDRHKNSQVQEIIAKGVKAKRAGR